MISKSAVQQAVEEWLQGKEYFLVDISISPDDRIVVEIDHQDEDYELEVGSAGLGQPFRVRRQYEIHVGKEVETQLHDGHKLRGTLLSVSDEGFCLSIPQKVKEEGKKRPIVKEVPTDIRFEDVAYTKYLIKVK